MKTGEYAGVAPADPQWQDLPALLEQAETSAEARNRLVTLLYPELKRLADAQMRRERRDHTLQATALVSEFFVQIAKNPPLTAKTRTQFLAVAAVAMRRLLVDYARARGRDKRGGKLARVDLDHIDAPDERQSVDVLEIDELLSQLSAQDPRMARIVELRFFGGLTMGEIGDCLAIHERTGQARLAGCPGVVLPAASAGRRQCSPMSGNGSSRRSRRR